MIPLQVTAHLDAPCAGVIEQPFMLDGPLAWALATAAPAGTYPPITNYYAADMPVPLARWEESGTWGWRTSQALYTVASHGSIEIRRKPADTAFSRFTKERKHHHGLGPHKARDLVVPTTWIHDMTWQVEVTSESQATSLASLLLSIDHLGAHRAIGLGHVARWQINDGTPDAWRNRPMPVAGETASHRAPYWHPSRRVTT